MCICMCKHTRVGGLGAWNNNDSRGEGVGGGLLFFFGQFMINYSVISHAPGMYVSTLWNFIAECMIGRWEVYIEYLRVCLFVHNVTIYS